MEQPSGDKKLRYEPKVKFGRRHNAVKHGLFVQELFILDENQKDFYGLHDRCIKELKPSGAMEEEVVLAIAKYMWRKRRVDRLFIQEAKRLGQHPAIEELNTVSYIDQFIEVGQPCSYVSRIVARLPALVRLKIEKLPRPKNEFDDEWIRQVKNQIRRSKAAIANPLSAEPTDNTLLALAAAAIRELTAKQVELEDRLDMMIDKALKRLANLKAFKEVMIIQEASRPQKISARSTESPNSI
jgi:hypothetical protein